MLISSIVDIISSLNIHVVMYSTLLASCVNIDVGIVSALDILFIIIQFSYFDGSEGRYISIVNIEVDINYNSMLVKAKRSSQDL